MTIAKFINEVGFKVREGDVKKVNDSIKSIKSTATKLLGAIGIGFSLTKINALVEEFGAANKQITSAVGEMENMDAVQGQVLQKANAARLAYTDMAGYVSNLAKAGSDIFPVDDAIQFTSTVAKLMKTNGRNDSAISSMMEGFNKSFQKGIVDTETLNKMLEQAPETANVLAQSLGVAKSQLLDMASNGKMTVQQLKDAFMDASGEIDAAFQNSNMSISDGLKNIRNNWGLWLTQMNSTLGITNTIARAMVKFSDTAMRVMNRVRNAVVWLGDKLGGTDKVLRLIAISAGALFIAFNFEKITKGIQAVFTGLRNVNKQALVMAAAFIIVALLVEDFINFMQGNNSLLGSLLEKAGVDVDKFRANIIKIWGNIKTILTTVWQGIKNVAIPIFQTIWGVIKTVFEAIGKIIDKIAPQFANLADQLANGNIDTDKWVKVGEAIAKIIAVIVGVVAAVKTVIAVVRTVTSVVQGVSAVISFVTSPVGLVILAIMALIAVGILLYKNWDKIKAFAIRIWTAIKDFFVNIFTSIGNFFTSIWEGISTFFSSVWNGIKETVSGAVSAVWEVISTVFSTIWEFISGVATNIWTSITTAFTNRKGECGMIGKGKALIVHDDCMVSRVAHRLEELCGEIELCQSILNNAPDLPAEYRRVNKEQARQRLELARWNLDDLLEDIEDGIVTRELKRIYNEYCRGVNDGEV